LHVILHDDVFDVPPRDTDLHQEVARRGCVFVSHDAEQARIPEERDSLMSAGLRAFFVRGQAPVADLADAFLAALPEIQGLLERNRDPFIARVYKPGPGQAKRLRVSMTYAQWLKRKR